MPNPIHPYILTSNELHQQSFDLCPQAQVGNIEPEGYEWREHVSPSCVLYGHLVLRCSKARCHVDKRCEVRLQGLPKKGLTIQDTQARE
jgi:hypothetical protein